MIRSRRYLRVAFRCVLLGVLLLVLGVGLAWWYFTPAYTDARGIVFTQRHGHDLTLSVIRPANPSGAGVLMMVSGSWKSDPHKFQPWMAASFLRQGMTVIAITHLSQPQATIMEIVEDVHRAARFVRHHAKDYGIDPKRIGVIGGSSGGHLSLMLATRGCPGDPAAPDPIDREDSSVQAVAVFYPVTDLLNLGSSTQNLHDGGPPKSFRNSFGPDAANLEKWKVIGRDVSPIFHISEELPPVFIVHGSADTLVPLDQSQRFQKRASDLGEDVELLIRPGKKHGWPTMFWDAHLFAGWLSAQLSAE
jgi:acetyl esterase/lipase